MAVVTLKDLMDPLTKLVAATEKNSQKLDSFISIVGSGSGASLNKEVIKELQIQTNLLKVIAGNTKGGGASDTSAAGTDKLKGGGEALKILGAGASSLALGLMVFTFVPKKAVTIFFEVVTELFKVFETIPDTGEFKKGTEAFAIISQNIGQFAKALAMSSFLLIPGLLGARLFITAINMLIPTFQILGDSEKRIDNGAQVLGLMGSSLQSFAKGLVLIAIASVIGILFTPMIVLSLIIIGGAFALIGSMDKTIENGARTVNKMGRALVFFSVGLVTFALASLFILLEPKILLAMVGSLILIGGAFALLGIFDKSIRKGAVALFFMSVGLILFSIGYLVFALATKNVTIEDIGIQAGVLIGLGITIGILGIFYTSLIKGAIGIAAMGIGLIIFSLGYLPFAMVTKDMTIGDLGLQAGILLGLGLEFAAAGVGALFILAGAAAFAAVGLSLVSLSFGLLAIKKVDFTEDDSLKLATMLSGVKAGFLGGGGSDEGFFAKVGGAITGAVDSVRMIEAAAGFAAAGVALKLLAFGLTAIKKVGFTQEDSIELTTMLNGITTAFALAGSEKQVPSTSFFGQMFGFKRSSVEEGIMSVMSAGKALTSITKGLISFQELVDKKIDFAKLGTTISYTVGFINQAFSAVAEQGNVEAGGFFNSLFGIKKNKVAEGIDSVKGAGKELTSIVTGLKSFQELVDKEINWDTLGKAISKSIGFVSDAFASIGGKEETDGFFVFSWDENMVAKGVSAVKGAGKELMNIATGLKTYQDMIDNEVDFGKLATAVKNSIMFVGDAFMAIGGKEQTDSSFFGLIKWDENLVNKGIENVKGAGQELTNIAKGIKAFSELKDPAAIANSIKTIFTSIGDTFTFYYEKPKFKSQLDHMKGFITEISDNAKNGYIDKAAKGMNEIAKAVNSIDKGKAESFASLFKGAGDLSNNKDAFNSLLKAVEEIRDALAGGATPTPAATPVVATPVAAGGTTPTEPGLGTTLARISSTLQSLNTTMTGLPGAISLIKIKSSD